MQVLSSRTFLSALAIPRLAACFCLPQCSRFVANPRRTDSSLSLSPDGAAPDVMANNQTTNQARSKPSLPAKFHHITICLVPPEMEANQGAWEALIKARTELRDPGFFRWPPHANLLYPFVDPRVKGDRQQEDTTQQIASSSSDTLLEPEILDRLQEACRQIEPFVVRLQRLGTFGGSKRGVLWIYPMSCRDAANACDDEEPLVELQCRLQAAFPYCSDQQKTAGRFMPHMTMSHFEDLDAALEAQSHIETWWDTSLMFYVSEIYLLYRRGDQGQFERLATLGLGSQGNVTVHDPTLPFVSMPREEVDWVREERMKLKARRNHHRGSRSGRRRRSRSGTRSTSDTPEIIAQKRAARKVKREALEREAAEKKELVSGEHDDSAAM